MTSFSLFTLSLSKWRQILLIQILKLFQNAHYRQKSQERKNNSHKSHNFICALTGFIFCAHNYTLRPNLETHKNIRSYHRKSTYNQKNKSDYFRFHTCLICFSNIRPSRIRERNKANYINLDCKIGQITRIMMSALKWETTAAPSPFFKYNHPSTKPAIPLSTIALPITSGVSSVMTEVTGKWPSPKKMVAMVIADHTKPLRDRGVLLRVIFPNTQTNMLTRNRRKSISSAMPPSNAAKKL